MRKPMAPLMPIHRCKCRCKWGVGGVFATMAPEFPTAQSQRQMLRACYWHCKGSMAEEQDGEGQCRLGPSRRESMHLEVLRPISQGHEAGGIGQ